MKIQTLRNQVVGLITAALALVVDLKKTHPTKTPMKTATTIIVTLGQVQGQVQMIKAAAHQNLTNLPLLTRRKRKISSCTRLPHLKTR